MSSWPSSIQDLIGHQFKLESQTYSAEYQQTQIPVSLLRTCIVSKLSPVIDLTQKTTEEVPTSTRKRKYDASENEPEIPYGCSFCSVLFVFKEHRNGHERSLHNS